MPPPPLALGRVVETGIIRTASGEALEGVLIRCSADSLELVEGMWGKPIVVLPLADVEALLAAREAASTELAEERERFASILQSAQHVCSEGKEDRVLGRLEALRLALFEYLETRR
jgi:hypothetical protein